MTRSSPLALFVSVLAILGLFLFLPSRDRVLYADDGVVLAPEGGRLDAWGPSGNALGPCALAHTDIDAEISGHFARVTLTQRYRNPFPDKIEAVYTFPMSHRAAVDRMKMTIGDRVVVGEVHERGKARQIYDSARESGYVASLLEQERPNIFTQSVANIEPGAEITIEISTVELLSIKDGRYGFDFPLVVGPRYIPAANAGGAPVPEGLEVCRGVVLLAPAALSPADAGDISSLGSLDAAKLAALLRAARPIAPPSNEWLSRPGAATGDASLWYRFEAAYPDGSREAGEIYTDGTGRLNGRWFYSDSSLVKSIGTGVSPNTPAVPDASRITPPLAKPGTRAGHDVSIRVRIDTGGPGIVDLKSAQHEIVRTAAVEGPGGFPRKVALALKNEGEIPNRDFVLTWKLESDAIEEAVLAHTSERGSFVTVILEPPARVPDLQAVPRELIFVLDTSGSMGGQPIEKAKVVIAKSIDRLRPEDTFNLITFSGDTSILWSEPRRATAENRDEAQRFLATRQGRGGTEMMKAIDAALVMTPQSPSPRSPIRIVCFLTDGFVGNDLAIIDAVKRNAATTRVFSFGIGNSVNRFLMDGMAHAGRGAVEYVLLGDDADEKVDRFVNRVETPVLTDIEVVFSDNLGVSDRLPGRIPDLFDVAPLVVHARYASAGSGTVTIRGNTGTGPFERTLPLDLPRAEPGHDTIATLWARQRVEDLMDQDLASAQSGNYPQPLRDQVVALGEAFGIVTPFTSFVAVEKMTVTLGGEPRLVSVPVEIPDGVDPELGAGSGLFGKGRLQALGYVRGSADYLIGASRPNSVAGLRGRRGGRGVATNGHSSPAEPAPSSPPASAPATQKELRVPVERIERAQLDKKAAVSFGEEISELESLDDGASADGVSGARAAMEIPDLLAKGQLAEARRLAEAAAARDPQGKFATPLRDLLKDETLDPALRDQRLAALRDEAKKALDAAERRAKLERRLDPRLLALLAKPQQGVPPAGITFVSGGIALSVLTSNLDDSTLDTLKKAGLVVASTAESVKVVVGVAPLDKLEGIALLDAVIFVEPAELK